MVRPASAARGNVRQLRHGQKVCVALERVLASGEMFLLADCVIVEVNTKC